MNSTLKRTWADIRLDHLTHNLNAIRRQVGDTPRLLGVVKADAYGHGAVQVARHLAEHGVSYLAVSNCDEAEELRTHGIELPILILGYTPPDQTERLVRLNITQCVQDLQTAQAYQEALRESGHTLRIHIKLETGMGRLGFSCDEAHFSNSMQQICDIVKMPQLDAEGVFTHFAVSDEEDADCRSFTEQQHERFVRAYWVVESATGHLFKLHHCANSGAIAYHPQYAHDMVRCGIVLYGAGDMVRSMDVKPVMSFQTTVAALHDYDPGKDISYGRTFTTKEASRIAVLPVGYADGLFRTLSGKLVVSTPYGDANQTGRICMDMCMADVTKLPDLKTGDTVEIFGDTHHVNDVAKQCGTIPYELLCAVSKRVPRLYCQNGQLVETQLKLL